MRQLPRPGDIVTIHDAFGDDVIGVINDGEGVCSRVCTVGAGTLGICVDVLKGDHPVGDDLYRRRGSHDVRVLVKGQIVTFWDEEVLPVRDPGDVV